ncbi:MAG: hypothetical protein DME25_12770 [Verrucomicrobia bacterium]|nr:MAG: hypothetical protein DME25_12770 [Verrucomicrobiota bacterium]
MGGRFTAQVSDRTGVLSLNARTPLCLNHLTLAVGDLDRSVAFYSELLYENPLRNQSDTRQFPSCVFEGRPEDSPPLWKQKHRRHPAW